VFRSEHPQVEIVVHDVVASRVVQMVKSGEADIGITADSAKDRELFSELLLIDRLCAFVPREHAVANHQTVSLRELLSEPLILTAPDSSVRELLSRKARGEPASLMAAYQVNYLSSALGFVEAGLGIAILPESSLNGNSSSSVRTLPIEPIVRRRVTLIRRRATEYSHAAAEFVQCLKQKAGSDMSSSRSGRQRRSNGKRQRKARPGEKHS
jgi:DNA-binding transcriptional LysR family regulator